MLSSSYDEFLPARSLQRGENHSGMGRYRRGEEEAPSAQVHQPPGYRERVHLYAYGNRLTAKTSNGSTFMKNSATAGGNTYTNTKDKLTQVKLYACTLHPFSHLFHALTCDSTFLGHHIYIHL